MTRFDLSVVTSIVNSRAYGQLMVFKKVSINLEIFQRLFIDI